MGVLAWVVIGFAVIYLLAVYWDEIRDRFWRWVTEKSPYFRVSREFSLTDQALKKYTSEALIRKTMELEAEVNRLQNTLKEIEEKMYKHKEFNKQQEEQVDEKIKEVLELPTLLAPVEPIKVIDVNGVFRGYLEAIKGTFSEAYIIVRTKDNERLIFGPDELTNLLWSEFSLNDQLKGRTLILAYDRYNNKVSPSYTRVEV